MNMSLALVSFVLAQAAQVVLPVPARSHAPESPKEGWCGETSIQEGLLHLGVWAPQRVINKAGKPSHPDLYSPDIPVALAELGVRFSMYQPKTRGFGAYSDWVKKAIDDGVPVLAGVKILPTKHPEWGLDHFVTVIGYGEQGLLVNTTWGSRQWVDDKATTGLSFTNAFYAIRFDGLKLAAGRTVARVTVLEETTEKVKLKVTCKDGAREVVQDASKVARFDCPAK